METKPGKHNRRQNRPKPETEARYGEALELYRTTRLSINAICEQNGISFNAFRSYIRRWHRELMFARYGIEISPLEAETTKLRNTSGQTLSAHAKYKEAILACDDMAYIKYNVSQIAHIFRLTPSGLGHQLHSHYPEILERREKKRQQLGINDNLHRGVKPWCMEQYAGAVEHLRTSDDTIRQTAARYNISYSGLREHLLYYYKDLVRKRATKRKQAKACKKRGALTGNGVRHLPSPRQTEKYRKAVHLYRTTAMTQKEIVSATGVSINGFRNYLRVWHRDLILERRGIKCHECEDICLSDTKHYLKSTAAKYAGAIEILKEGGRSTAEVARDFNLNPETFRMYLHEHEPELAASLGRMCLSDGKQVSVRSMNKYQEAIRLYETTTESLKSIARRLGLQYNSVGGFIRRNRFDVIETHNQLLADKEKRERIQKQNLSFILARRKEEEEKTRIRQALEQTGNNRQQAAKLLGICKSTLYNKLKNFDFAK